MFDDFDYLGVFEKANKQININKPQSEAFKRHHMQSDDTSLLPLSGVRAIFERSETK